jgi:hypothetical protein
MQHFLKVSRVAIENSKLRECSPSAVRRLYLAFILLAEFQELGCPVTACSVFDSVMVESGVEMNTIGRWLRLPRGRDQAQRLGTQPALPETSPLSPWPVHIESITRHTTHTTKKSPGADSYLSNLTSPTTLLRLLLSVPQAPLRFLANSRYVNTTLRSSFPTPLSQAYNSPGAS